MMVIYRTAKRNQNCRTLTAKQQQQNMKKKETSKWFSFQLARIWNPPADILEKKQQSFNFGGRSGGY